MNKKVRVIVIDDSVFMRKVLTDIINEDPRLEVVATANNGKEGLKAIEKFHPDVITLDIEMPIMSGLEMLRKLKDKKFIPTIMVSSLTKEGAKETLEALDFGAVDFITKPKRIFSISSDEIKAQLIEKIIIASKISSKKIVPLKMFSTKNIKEKNCKLPLVNKDTYRKKNGINKMIVIGTSTGGPKALQYVIPYIPENIDASILIVQHMPPGFTKSLAERLNQLSEIIVKEAEDGEPILKGVAYIAPGNQHMEIRNNGEKGYQIKLTKEAPVGGHRPAVDVMLASVAKNFYGEIFEVMMTGMGSDGAKSTALIRENPSSFIIAQSEKTCVVYGMPKVIVQKSLVDEVVDLENISKKIIRKVGVL